MRRHRVGPWILLFVLAVAVPVPAHASGLVGSARFGLGFGGRLADELQGDSPYALALDLRGDALASPRRRPRLRLGPAVELRSASANGGFRSFEASAGLALVTRLGDDDVALSSTTLVGGAYRADRVSSPQIAQILALGFRDWKSRPRYAASTSLFLALHAALGGSPFYEVTGGVEVDLLFLGLPFVLLRDRIRGS